MTARIMLTPEQAEALLADGEYVHNFVGGGMALIGCDYSRDVAIEAFRNAKEIEISGGISYGMGHPLAVLDKQDRRSFFAADMEKVKAFEGYAA